MTFCALDFWRKKMLIKVNTFVVQKQHSNSLGNSSIFCSIFLPSFFSSSYNVIHKLRLFTLNRVVGCEWTVSRKIIEWYKWYYHKYINTENLLDFIYYYYYYFWFDNFNREMVQASYEENYSIVSIHSIIL